MYERSRSRFEIDHGERLQIATTSRWRPFRRPPPRRHGQDGEATDPRRRHGLPPPRTRRSPPRRPTRCTLRSPPEQIRPCGSTGGVLLETKVFIPQESTRDAPDLSAWEVEQLRVCYHSDSMLRYDKIVRLMALAFVCGAIARSGRGLGVRWRSATRPPPTAPRPSPGTAVTAAPGSGGAASPMTAQAAKEIGANEFGLIPVLEYHKIGTPESQWTRTPANFRKDLALLKAAGFYPINLADLAAGAIDVPAGKSPVVLTFDDSSPGQFRVLDDGSVDPDSAVGIMQQAVKGGGWASESVVLCSSRRPPRRQRHLRPARRSDSEVARSRVMGLRGRRSHGDAPEPQEGVAARRVEKQLAVVGGNDREVRRWKLQGAHDVGAIRRVSEERQPARLRRV